jgi:flagellar basal body rod protein FlgG
MAGGQYLALNGMRTRLDELDRVAADLSNVGTSGYKRERISTHGSERLTFDAVVQKATDPTIGERRIDFANGEIAATNRELDFAIEGTGFFVVETAAGPRYTRNGSFNRRTDGTLVTTDGLPVLGKSGPLQIGVGPVSVDADGTVRAGATVAGQLEIVDSGPNASIAREGFGRFRIDTVTTIATPSVRNRAVEKSNVSAVDSMVYLTSLSRNFDALQRGLVALMDEVDGRAITELGRRG